MSIEDVVTRMLDRCHGGFPLNEESQTLQNLVRKSHSDVSSTTFCTFVSRGIRELLGSENLWSVDIRRRFGAFELFSHGLSAGFHSVLSGTVEASSSEAGQRINQSQVECAQTRSHMHPTKKLLSVARTVFRNFCGGDLALRVLLGQYDALAPFASWLLPENAELVGLPVPLKHAFCMGAHNRSVPQIAAGCIAPMRLLPKQIIQRIFTLAMTVRQATPIEMPSGSRMSANSKRRYKQLCRRTFGGQKCTRQARPRCRIDVEEVIILSSDGDSEDDVQVTFETKSKWTAVATVQSVDDEFGPSRLVWVP